MGGGRMSNSLDSDQARQNFEPNLDTNCLLRLSADECDQNVKSLDSDQAQQYVEPDLDPNYLQRLSADDISR